MLELGEGLFETGENMSDTVVDLSQLFCTTGASPAAGEGAGSGTAAGPSSEGPASPGLPASGPSAGGSSRSQMAIVSMREGVHRYVCRSVLDYHGDGFIRCIGVVPVRLDRWRILIRSQVADVELCVTRRRSTHRFHLDR